MISHKIWKILGSKSLVECFFSNVVNLQHCDNSVLHWHFLKKCLDNCFSEYTWIAAADICLFDIFLTTKSLAMEIFIMSLKAHPPGLSKFLATKIPLKKMKNALYFTV